MTSQQSQGSGVNKDVSFTLNSIDIHGVVYMEENNEKSNRKMLSDINAERIRQMGGGVMIGLWVYLTMEILVQL